MRNKQAYMISTTKLFFCFLDLIRSKQNLLQRVHYWCFQETIHFSQGLSWYAPWTGISLIFHTTALWAHYVCNIEDNLKVKIFHQEPDLNHLLFPVLKWSNLSWSWGEQIDPIFVSHLKNMTVLLLQII